MIERHFLFPEYYVQKVAKCDECKIELQDTGVTIMSNPPIMQYNCPKCGKIYEFTKTELEGGWKWRIL